ncbi:early nodulin-like protein 15 [Malus domestica]|uniref:early nodulin-like protein 15 n=1 Tax=Malus domestica TaxID=3750 RepID=UPI0039755B90
MASSINIEWKKEQGRDSVVQVTKEAYETCVISKPIKADVEEITLNKSGPFCFISGVKEHCDMGLKLTVVVLSEKHKYGSDSPSPAPAAAPSSNAAARGFSLSAAFIAVGVAVGVWLCFERVRVSERERDVNLD